MANAKQTAAGPGVRPMARPLSPHLSVFRFYPNMTMSILHRMTGAANYFGALLLAAWLIAAATSDEWFNTVSALLGTPIGLIILFGFSWSVIHHMLGGIRHFIWDTIHGFSKSAVKLLSWLSILLSVGLTGALWMTVLSQMGKF
jgi:succinate dehydrogenase / fumarate reductase, cytochrome b subunit